MKTSRLFLAGAALLTFAFGCVKPCSQGGPYILSATGQYYPEREDYAVGDTIWLSISIPTQQPGVLFIHAVNLSAILYIINIDSFHTRGRGAVEDFVVTNKIGRLYTGDKAFSDLVLQAQFVESDTAYTLLAGLIAKKEGYYDFFTPDIGSGIYRRGGSPSCGAAVFFLTNANPNKHLNLIEDKIGPLSDSDSARSYCFMVK